MSLSNLEPLVSLARGSVPTSRPFPDRRGSSRLHRRQLRQPAPFCGLCLLIGVLFLSAPSAVGVTASFAENVDLEAIRLIAVQDQGRIKTFDTLAREVMYDLSHTERFEGQDPVLTCLDLMLNPAAYQTQNIIYLGKYALRKELADRLRDTLPASVLAQIEKEGRVSPAFLDRAEVRHVLFGEMAADIQRFSSSVESIRVSREACNGELLRHRWRIIPPPGGDAEDSWFDGDRLWGHGIPQDEAHARVQSTGFIPGLEPEKAEKLVKTFKQLENAWRANDAPAASAALNELAAIPPTIEPDLYPSATRRALERWYVGGKVLFWANNKMTWTWVVYFIAFVLLLMAFVYGWPRARRFGLAAFGLAFVLHSLAVGIRWYLQGRIPNANMFEAVTMSVWFGAGVGIVLEAIFRRSAMRNLFVLAASAAAMFALMAGYFIPVTLGANMSVMMPVLNTIWLRIHTNLIIASYALIGIATTTAIVYLVWHQIVQPSLRLLGALAVPTLFFAVGMSDALGWTHAFSQDNPRMIGAVLSVTTPFALVFIPAMLIGLVGMAFPALSRVWAPQFALATAGGTAPLKAGGALGDERSVRSTTGQGNAGAVLDGATMILMQLSFITLWVGLILGAVWADVSWGRPWGWDPKEVFALNTWIIFLILVHVRMKVRDKAFWTAILCVTGCAVMLFNWIAINFVITGLHSYAS